MIQTGQRTCHYTELTDLPPDRALYHEWHTYLQELPRWLAEGKEGQFVLIKGTAVIGFYDGWDAARDVSRERFLMHDVLIQQIREREPVYRQFYRKS